MVTVAQATPEETLEILGGLRNAYQDHHGVRFTDEALKAAVALTVRYVPERRLPDKARDVVNRAAAARGSARCMWPPTRRRRLPSGKRRSPRWWRTGKAFRSRASAVISASG